MRKKIKILLIFIFFFVVVINIGFSYVKGFNSDEWKPDTYQNDTKFDNKVKTIVGVIRSIGIVISVGALIIIGIKTITGSVEEKSHYKEVLPGYILGAIMVMMITSIPSIIYEFASNLK